ncbi:MAG: hypothetical protein QXS19_07595 [Candidatus Methanomethylicia archaeon]
MRYVLKIDIDRKRKVNRLARDIVNRIKHISRYASISIADIRAYETRRGYHIELDIDAPLLDNKDIAFLQLLLLSDWKREIFNWLRARSSEQLMSWNILFDAKLGNDSIYFRGKTDLALELENAIKKLLGGDTDASKN